MWDSCVVTPAVGAAARAHPQCDALSFPARYWQDALALDAQLAAFLAHAYADALRGAATRPEDAQARLLYLLLLRAVQLMKLLVYVGLGGRSDAQLDSIGVQAVLRLLPDATRQQLARLPLSALLNSAEGAHVVKRVVNAVLLFFRHNPLRRRGAALRRSGALRRLRPPRGALRRVLLARREALQPGLHPALARARGRRARRRAPAARAAPARRSPVGRAGLARGGLPVLRRRRGPRPRAGRLRQARRPGAPRRVRRVRPACRRRAPRGAQRRPALFLGQLCQWGNGWRCFCWRCCC